MPLKEITHYRVVRRLGAGGMGEVFLAQDTQLDRLVALKVMSIELAKDPNQRKRFWTEAKAASRLSHPHICVIHEVGETQDSRPYIAMEYVEGQTLDVVLQQRRLKLREVLNLGIEVAEALDAAHARGLVHRDIKPGNIMLEQRGQAKVMDFGLAKRFDLEELSGAITSVAHTRTGMLVGTPQYMSPEQALGRPLDPRTDLFSLGVVLYELVAGQRPFLGKTVGETINNVVNQAPAAMGLENPVYSPALDIIIFKCLEKDPEKRYTSAKKLAKDLRKLKEDSDRAVTAITHQKDLAGGPPAADERRPTTAKESANDERATGSFTAGIRRLSRWFFPGEQESTSLVPANNLIATTQHKSVAVLPFVNMSADKADDYLCDGMSEEIIISLSKVKGLKVPARTSCFAFKGKNEDIRRIGEQLGVSSVLEGSISKVGTRLRVSAQLISTGDGFHIWSETYDRGLDDLLAIRTEVATRVAEALKGQLLGEESHELAKRTTEHPEAYRLYLKGRYLCNRRTGESLNQAIEYFNQAIGKDPNYALAYAALVECSVVISQYAGQSPRKTYPNARAAALKGLELDNSLAELHTMLAQIKAYWDWDLPGAEMEFRQAIALNPNYALARHWFGIFLSRLDRPDEALTQALCARDLDPLSPLMNAGLGLRLAANGQVDSAIELLKNQIDADPSFIVAHEVLGVVNLQVENYPDAMAAFETMHRLDGSGIYALGELGFAYARNGKTQEARGVLARLQELQAQEYDMGLGIALVQHGLGNDEAALNSLCKAWEEQALSLGWPSFDICFRNLRSHVRFQALLRKAGLPR